MTVVARTACSDAPTARNGTTRTVGVAEPRRRQPSPAGRTGPSSGSRHQITPALATASAAVK